MFTFKHTIITFQPACTAWPKGGGQQRNRLSAGTHLQNHDGTEQTATDVMRQSNAEPTDGRRRQVTI